MHAQRGRWLIVLVLAIGLVAGTQGFGRDVAAQETGAPDEAVCEVTPRTVDDIIRIFDAATPAAEPAEGAVEGAVSVPTGRNASAEVTAGVTATIHEAFACMNAGDWLRFFALLTDNAIRMAFPWLVGEVNGDAIPPEFVQATPVPSDLVQTVISVAEVRSLGVDRAGAFVVFLDPSSSNPGANVLHLELLRSGADWLIDGVVEFTSE